MHREPTASSSTPVSSPSRRQLLSVVVPVYNGGDQIIENVAVIREATASGLSPEDVELVVVSDGSIDHTAERLLAARSDGNIRVIHYDRNLGKGYAVKVGALASHGEWVAIVDADLDLDPSVIPHYVAVAQRERLDFVVGSKRHPDSIVFYPRSRRLASLCYQQLNRLLFRLDVRDTQVGLKVFRRKVVEEVVPLLLVKRFAFDLELLAVAHELGFERIREMPVRLEYRFTGSEVRSGAVARALLDTAAIFYRLRILRTYQRKRRLLGSGSLHPDDLPLVTVVGDARGAHELDYSRLELKTGDVTEGARAARGELLGILPPGVHPAGNWLSATVPFIASGEAAAVVVPAVAPVSTSLREQAASAIVESRLGGGSRRFRYLPGNVRVVSDYPAGSCVIRKADFIAACAAGIGEEQLVSWLSGQGKRTIYTPDTSISARPAPLLRPHLRGTYDYAAARGVVARRTRGRSMSSDTVLALVPAACAGLAAGLLIVGRGESRHAAVGLLAACGVALASSASLAAVKFGSAAVGAVALPGLALTQATYVAGFLRGFAGRR